MEAQARVRGGPSDARPPGSPPAVWSAFAVQGAWKSWTIVGLLGLVGMQSVALARLASRPPEFVLVDAAGRTTPVRRSVATDALLKLVAERTRPPEMTVVRFTRDFLHLALALNSSTVEANWPAALTMMSPALRQRVEAEAAAQRLVETYRQAGRRTELAFEEVVIEDRTPSLLSVRAVIVRRTGPLLPGTAASASDRVEVELVERLVPPTMERPDGLEVEQWRLVALPPSSRPERARPPAP